MNRIKLDIKKFVALHPSALYSVPWDIDGDQVELSISDVKKSIDKCKFLSPNDPCDDLSYTDHVKRVAWLVVNYDEKKSVIDVENVGASPWCYTGFSINDGNHRLAAAEYLGKPWIYAEISGFVDVFKKLKYRS